ncbi:MAG: hypothetical protein CMJ59_16745 [Planctomycetaceae bacterium]|nr:hypothetical protein [Planctomycetaceae bacterium]
MLAPWRQSNRLPISATWLLAIVLASPTAAQDSSKNDPPGGPVSRRTLAWTTSRLIGSPEPPPPYRVAVAFTELKFQKPVALTCAPGEKNLFLLEQDGQLHAFAVDREVTRTQIVLDLGKLHTQPISAYGIAFHPHYQRNHYVYLCYALSGVNPRGSRLVRFSTDGAQPPRIDPASAQTILTWVSGGHNGGCLKFGPDGYLYISTGDASGPAPPDVHRAGQDVSNLLSSILRIDVDRRDRDRQYAIPADNPLVAVPGARGEIWSYGYRNPWKMSFDRVAGDLWVGDVGWELWEMIYRVKKGGNYGWSITEGPQPVHPEETPGPTPILPPTIQHPHSEAASITGGFVYRGRRLKELVGAYLYGDFQTGILWGARLSGEEVSWHQELAHTPLQLVAFGEDLAGELYLVDYRGQIFQIEENQQPDRSADFPRRLSQTGLFASTPEQKPAPGVLPYQINSPAWADHAQAQRWLAIPGRDYIATDGAGRWQFPDGSVLVKTIRLEANDSGHERLLETQLLHREEHSWRPYTYVWNDAQTDAELAPTGGLDLPRSDPLAAAGRSTWRVHSRAECLLCHNPWVEARTTVFGIQSASPLAVDAAQWNQLVRVAGQTVSQLARLHAEGWLELGTPAERPPDLPLVNPTDERQSLDRRARSYLHVNCAHCHQFNAGGAANIALSHSVPLANTGTLGIRPSQGTFGITSARIIAPGDPLGSVLFYRISKLGGGRMPRLGSGHVDRAAADMIHDWIAGLAPHPAPRGAPSEVLVEQLAAPSGTARTEAITALTATTRGALALLRWLDHHPEPSLRAQVLTATREHPATEVRDLFERFLPPDQRVKRLGTVVDRGAILRQEANVQRGRDVFFKNPAAACKNCHRIEKQGEILGPDLNQIGKKYSRAQLLDHILEPSKFMEPKYVPYLLETATGQILSGLLDKKTSAEVWLKDARNAIHKVPTEEVELLVRQRKSLMPELLLRDLTAQQVADLVAFLASLK